MKIQFFIRAVKCLLTSLLAFQIIVVQVSAQPVSGPNLGANVSSSTSNYQLLLEIRGLQREIAELRDRVDQQEFQIDRMRHSGAASNINPLTQGDGFGSTESNLPKNVKQFETGAVVEEIDLSGVPDDSKITSKAQASIPTPTSTTIPTTQAQGVTSQEPKPFFSAKPNLPTSLPSSEVQENTQMPEAVVIESPVNNPPLVAGQPGAVFGANNSTNFPLSTDQQSEQLYQPETNSVEQASPQAVIPRTVIPETVVPEAVLDNSNVESGSLIPSIPTFETPAVSAEQKNTTAQPQSVIQTPSAQDQLLESGDFGIKTELGEEEMYSNGLSELKQQDYEGAVNVLSAQLSRYPKGGRAPDAYYWIGESFYILERLNSAKKSYMSILNLFPESRRVPNAIYKVAVIEYEQGNTPAAREAINTLRTKYPQSSAAAQAQTRFSGLL